MLPLLWRIFLVVGTIIQGWVACTSNYIQVVKCWGYRVRIKRDGSVVSPSFGFRILPFGFYKLAWGRLVVYGSPRRDGGVVQERKTWWCFVEDEDCLERHGQVE